MNDLANKNLSINGLSAAYIAQMVSDTEDGVVYGAVQRVLGAIDAQVARKSEVSGWLTVVDAAENNLKDITFSIPLGCFTCVTGVSGSGKSTLVDDILRRALFRYFYNSKEKPGKYRALRGLDQLDKAIVIDQSAIGRTPRTPRKNRGESNRATTTPTINPSSH
jgi:excinuclease UvrABC ATPase subunit